MKIVHDSVMENYRRNFYNVYHTHIFPILESYEKERLQKLSLTVVVAIITGFLAFGVFVCSVSQQNDDLGEMLMFVAVAIGGIGCWIIYAIRDNFVGKLKKSCMGHIVQIFGNLEWMSKIDLIDDYEVRNSELFGRYENRTSDDCFKGEYKGVNFQICETDMWRMEGSGKNRRRVTVFKGALVKFDFNKDIKSKTIITTKGDARVSKPIEIFMYMVILSVFGGIMALSFQNWAWLAIVILPMVLFLFAPLFSTVFKYFKSKEQYLTEIKLEDPEFNKHYRAYSTDQVEGRYLITPAFMERFKHIQTAFGAKNAKCAFYDSHILFALSTSKNLFEVGGLFHTLKDPKQMEEFFNELTSIMRLIDRFKLTEHTGL